MKKVKQLLFELKMEVLKIVILRAFINSVIFFLIVNIVFSFLNVEYYYAAILSAIFMAVNTYLYYAQTTLKHIEDANPEVREMLRTAKDNLDQDNIMVRALHNDLIKRTKNIYSGNMISYRHLLNRLMIMGVLIVATLFSATISLDISSVQIPFDKLGIRGRIPSYGIEGPVNLEESKLFDDESIYGESRVARLGNEIIDLNIEPSMSELDLSKINDPKGVAAGGVSYPVEVGTPKGAELSLSKKPQESELVNAFYMKKISR